MQLGGASAAEEGIAVLLKHDISLSGLPGAAALVGSLDANKLHRSFAWWLPVALEHAGLRMTNRRT
jgi:hypothetical protein